MRFQKNLKRVKNIVWKQEYIRYAKGENVSQFLHALDYIEAIKMLLKILLDKPWQKRTSSASQEGPSVIQKLKMSLFPGKSHFKKLLYESGFLLDWQCHPFLPSWKARQAAPGPALQWSSSKKKRKKQQKQRR